MTADFDWHEGDPIVDEGPMPKLYGETTVNALRDRIDKLEAAVDRLMIGLARIHEIAEQAEKREIDATVLWNRMHAVRRVVSTCFAECFGQGDATAAKEAQR